MKKFLMLSVPIVALSFATGCGSTKELNCTMSDESDGMKMSQTVIVEFKKDTATKLDMTMETTIDDELKEYASELEDALKSSYSSVEGKDGVTIKTSTKDNVVSFSLVADIEKMDDETKEDLDMVGETETYDELKTSLEDEGYTCK